MGCNCGGNTGRIATRKHNRLVYRCNKCNFDISAEYKKQEETAKLLLKGTNSVRIHVVCSQCGATSVITTNL